MLKQRGGETSEDHKILSSPVISEWENKSYTFNGNVRTTTHPVVGTPGDSTHRIQSPPSFDSVSGKSLPPNKSRGVVYDENGTTPEGLG